MAKKKAKQKTKEQAEGGDAAAGSSSSRGARPLLILLIVLNLLALGTYGYLRLVKRKEVEQSLRSSQRGLPLLKQKASELRAVVERIRREEVQSISNPTETVQKTAITYGIADKVKVDAARKRRWKSSNYDEVTVRVSFLEKEGYAWADIIRFLVAIENANPKIHIKSIDFGKRDPNNDKSKEDRWRPLSMEVRILLPRSTA